MTRLFLLCDKAWAAVEPHLPHGRPGKPRVDDRRVISGIPARAQDRLPLAGCAGRVWSGHDSLQQL
jgi:transposase